MSLDYCVVYSAIHPLKAASVLNKISCRLSNVLCTDLWCVRNRKWAVNTIGAKKQAKMIALTDSEATYPLTDVLELRRSWYWEMSTIPLQKTTPTIAIM